MLKLSDLKAVARPAAGGGNADATIDVPADAHAGALVDALTEYFGEDDSRKAIELVVGGEPFGFVNREDLYALASPAQKGIGSSEYATLPGKSNYRLIRLRCSVPGCPHRLMVTTFDEEDPPMCRLHPGQPMEIES